MQHFLDIANVWMAHATFLQMVAAFFIPVSFCLAWIAALERNWFMCFVSLFGFGGCIAIVTGIFDAVH